MGGASCLIARDVARNLAAAQDIEEGTTTLDLRLEPGLVVSGTVEDMDGKPLSDAALRVFLWSGTRARSLIRSRSAPMPRGASRSPPCPPAGSTAWMRTPRATAQPTATSRRKPTPTGLNWSRCVLRVADRKLAGTVVDANDKPVVRASVFMYGQDSPTAPRAPI